MGTFALDREEAITLPGREAFEAAFNEARLLPLVADSTSAFEHVEGTGYFLTADRRSGFAIRPDGELVYVFSTVRGRGDILVRAAIALGAVRLDCFDGYLTDLYRRNGFDVTRREPNWTPGGPDVVYMRLFA